MSIVCILQIYLVFIGRSRSWYWKWYAGCEHWLYDRRGHVACELG